ncbi:MAG: hypothetical protein GX112_00680 [Clostridiaceae bacterium]|jgi:hypothetical protein|nr:hypothetical protein [Clostridiaceae bacterium]
MARYCFYCGRELNSGEKCGCRATAQPTGASGDSQPKQAETTSRKTRVRTPFWKKAVSFFNPFTGQKTKSGEPGPHQRHRSFRLDRQGSTDIFRHLAVQLAHPASPVNLPDSRKAGGVTVLVLFTSSLLGGLLLLLGTRQPQLSLFLSLNTATALNGYAFASQLFIFLQGVGISLAANLLLAVLYQLALRLLYRQRLQLVRLVHQLAPAYLYASLFALSALLVLSGSFFSALLMLAAGLAASAILQFLVLRRLTGFDDNRTFLLTAFTLAVYTSILALLLNLSLPVLNALLDHSGII